MPFQVQVLGVKLIRVECLSQNQKSYQTFGIHATRKLNTSAHYGILYINTRLWLPAARAAWLPLLTNFVGLSEGFVLIN